jgi:hypothetical protein
MAAELSPAENIALTVAKAQVSRGDAVTPHIAVVLVMALDRLVNGVRWRDEVGS